jgi:methylthioxylose transferase
MPTAGSQPLRSTFCGQSHSPGDFPAAKIVAMRWIKGLILAVEALLVVALLAAIRGKAMPLGIKGEWEWLRVTIAPPFDGLMEAGLAVAAYCVFAALGLRAVRRGMPSRFREGGWLAGLFGAGVAVQVLIPAGAPDEYDLTKWAYVNYFSPSTGYYKVAKAEAVSDPWRFLAEYPAWIRGQDSLHIGTHPPGLIAVQCLLLRAMEANPAAVEILIRSMPSSTYQGFRQLEKMDRRSIPRADRASLYLTALLTLLSCAGTVVPLYLLARSVLPPGASWVAAALWPLAPAVNLFQPGADTAYPLLSASALALTAWGSRWSSPETSFRAGPWLAALSGMVMAFGMAFTLAFLPVGLIVALLIISSSEVSSRRKAGLILATGAGFLLLVGTGWGLTGANPAVVWFWNVHHHARFYDEYPRTYLAWLAANPAELAIALGLPSTIWCAVGYMRPRSVPRIAWVTLAVLCLMNLTGKNMGEVARLWMLFLPPLLIAAGPALTRVGGGPLTLALTAGLLGLQTLGLQTLIQVVYPV